jgi:hypothetical protein
MQTFWSYKTLAPMMNPEGNLSSQSEFTRVIGRDEGGRLIEAIGFEPDALIAQCRRAASQMNIPAAPPNHQQGT